MIKMEGNGYDQPREEVFSLDTECTKFLERILTEHMSYGNYYKFCDLLFNVNPKEIKDCLTTIILQNPRYYLSSKIIISLIEHTLISPKNFLLITLYHHDIDMFKFVFNRCKITEDELVKIVENEVDLKNILRCEKLLTFNSQFSKNELLCKLREEIQQEIEKMRTAVIFNGIHEDVAKYVIELYVCL